ncbi:antibiotic biosynthesis monooxygenase [Muricauda oceani]|uniref:ABM domain-containing protein n=1 Tax=Flagellimonas oceani TaxID=2698672 RepID=A0A6G7IZ76_9FLAO|nr:antibiotic biosynthesis monooxygenase [Allomuricauda oceani]MBW8244885.1 antibiotic biosynthesis monooxygenase [Allomuricauda oceani]QII43547.1 hypothetical protein GVT53_02215 [Allomuricauda oceani]
MKAKKKKQYNTAGTARNMASIIYCLALFTLQLGCGKHQENTTSEKTQQREMPTSASFQELGFFGNIKASMWPEFLEAVQHNVALSRRESGNMVFSLYQPENEKLAPIWFERFHTKSAHNFHKEQAYFQEAIAVIQRSLEGDAKAIRLLVLDEFPATLPIKAAEPARSRHVITLYAVKEEKRQSFLQTMSPLIANSRKSTGNLEFNLYQHAEDAKVFVLIEGWKTRSHHEANTDKEHVRKFGSQTKDFFVSKPSDTRWILKDISTKNQ